jgi:membrane protein
VEKRKQKAYALVRRARKVRARRVARLPESRFGRFILYLRQVLRIYSDAEVSSRSASVTYYAIFSIFPLIIAVGNVLPLLGIKYQSALQYLNQIIPVSILKWLEPIIRSLLGSANGGVLSIGLLVTFWSASRGINELKTSFDRIYGVKQNQNFLIKRFVSLLLMFVIVVVLGAILLVFALGSQVLEWLSTLIHLSTAWLDTFNALRWPVTLVALLVALLLIYYFLPNVRLRFVSILPGTIFTMATGLGLAQLFSLYMRYFGTRYNSYGTIGSFMALLLWLNLSGTFLLIGAVINAAIPGNRREHTIQDKNRK